MLTPTFVEAAPAAVSDFAQPFRQFGPVIKPGLDAVRLRLGNPFPLYQMFQPVGHLTRAGQSNVPEPDQVGVGICPEPVHNGGGGLCFNLQLVQSGLQSLVLLVAGGAVECRLHLGLGNCLILAQSQGGCQLFGHPGGETLAAAIGVFLGAGGGSGDDGPAGDAQGQGPRH